MPVVPTRMAPGGKYRKWSQQQRKKIAHDVPWGHNWKKKKDTEEVIYNIKRNSEIQTQRIQNRKQSARDELGCYYPIQRNSIIVIHKDYLLPSMYVLKCVSLSLLFGLQVVSHMLQTLWTPAHQAPLPMAFPSQEYWSGLPFPSLISLTYPQKYVSL